MSVANIRRYIWICNNFCTVIVYLTSWYKINTPTFLKRGVFLLARSKTFGLITGDITCIPVATSTRNQSPFFHAFQHLTEWIVSRFFKGRSFDLYPLGSCCLISSSDSTLSFKITHQIYKLFQKIRKFHIGKINIIIRYHNLDMRHFFRCFTCHRFQLLVRFFRVGIRLLLTLRFSERPKSLVFCLLLGTTTLPAFGPVRLI